MADDTDDSEKTEDPSQRKLDEALSKGDIPRSQEVSAWFALVGTALVVAFFAAPVAISLSGLLKGFFIHAGTLSVDGVDFLELWRETAPQIFKILAAPFLTLLLLAAVGSLIQSKPIFTAEKLIPKLSKISPLAGLKRLFSKESLMNFLKGLVKIVIVAVLMFFVLWPERDRLDTMVLRPGTSLLPEVQELSLLLIGAILALMTVVAAADYAWQRYQWFTKLKMTQREVKDEHKQAEGDPQIKARIRQLRQQRARTRMMAQVPEATVVVTNPTHYAVALKYEEGMGAPLCVAKGLDAVALRIREVAKDSEVPVVENPPLARALHAAIEVGDMVPEEHFAAVAKVIGYVINLKSRRSWRS
ncbi:flagellar biosynthesis protein FlhB [Rhodobacteraceae bacterium RKSG542]|uniref:flagellar biosynthesis protein FlhB n=1 Tax=Pseudovibrio flavus TaxID=2529854 RepID=UPI0012BD0E7B|nr:flagellar biosynthesis protein FlhB [Pseudovibrio flavus]MTI19286.1 flagellar biosynthesis protein FlhB [Pseudovibrio flavus]